MISYHIGDATAPRSGRSLVLAHVCNDRGGWGAGFVKAISGRWFEPEEVYRNREDYPLGDTDFIEVEDGFVVANMIAQRSYRSKRNPHPLQLDWLAVTLAAVDEFAVDVAATIVMPRIGCGLGGGSWTEVEPLVSSLRSPVEVFDLP